jgi:hypothetical protein
LQTRSHFYGILRLRCASLRMTLTREAHLHIRLGLGKADDFLAFLPLTALFQKLDSLEAL